MDKSIIVVIISNEITLIMNQADPLFKLVVSETQAVNKQELTELLLPYASFNKETKELDFSLKFRNLSNIDKIFILLAALKARAIVFSVEEKISPKDIINLEIMPAGSVKATLKGLLDAGDIKSEKGKYFLPNYKLPQIIKRFENNPST